MDTVYRYFAALYASRAVPAYIKECRTVVTCLTNNAQVPITTPPLSQVTQDINTLDDREQEAHNGPKGSAAKRNDALLVVRGDMRHLKSCVQLAADADITHAQGIIEGAGMYVVTRVSKPKPPLAARYGGASGLVILDGKAIDGQGSYQWQMNGGQAWVDLPPSVVATVVVSGLTPVTLYSFRYRTLTGVGFSDWSVPVTIIAR
jgi:hypothetical protein